MSDADFKTLRLAALPMDNDRTEKLIAGWRAELKVMAEHGGVTPAAHQAAVDASGLPEAEYGRLSSMAREFCGLAWTERHLRERLSQLKAEGKEQDKIQRAEERLASTAERDALAARFGGSAIRAFELREADLVALHRQLARFLK